MLLNNVFHVRAVFCLILILICLAGSLKARYAERGPQLIIEINPTNEGRKYATFIFCMTKYLAV